MQRAAEAMGCRFVYALVPTESLDGAVRRQPRAKTRQELEPVSHSMGLEDQATSRQAALVDELAEDWIDRRGLWS